VLRERPTFEVGNHLHLSLTRGATHFFDEESGKRLG
jgi:hypothetical protein